MGRLGNVSLLDQLCRLHGLDGVAETMTSSIALFAPAAVRRSKKRLVAYEQKHAELRRDVEIMKADGPIGEMLAVALEMALEAEFGE